MTKVSIIIPVYNVERYLEECLDSVINQTFHDIEIICVNDGSTDNSLLILEKYAQRDNRIKIINKQNDGLGPARNTGLEYVTTELVCFIDSDDYFCSNAIEKLYLAYKRTQADIIIGKAQLFENFTNKKIDVRGWNTSLTSKRIICVQEDSSANLFQLISPMMHGKLFTVNLLKNFNLKFHKCKMHEDLTFSYSAVALANTIYLLDEIVYMYRTCRKDSLVANNKKINTNSWKDFSIAFNLLKQKLEIYDLYKKFYNTFCNALIYIILGNLKNISFINKLKLIFFVRKHYKFLSNLEKAIVINNKYYRLFLFIFWWKLL